MPDHPLAREIAATVIANRVVDQAGSAFAGRLARETGTSLAKAASAYLTFDRILEGPRLRQELHALDNRMAAARQYRLLGDLEQALAAMCGWALTHGMPVSAEEGSIAAFHDKVAVFEKNLGGILPAREWEQAKDLGGSLEEEGLAASSARRCAALAHLEDLLPLVSLNDATEGDLYSVARTYCEVRDFFGIPEIRERAGEVPVRDRWDRLAYRALGEELAELLYDLTLAILRQSGGNLEAFCAARRQKATYYQRLRDGLGGAVPANFHPYTVLCKALKELLD